MRQRLNYEADVRYFRQGYEFSLEVDPDRLGSGALNDLAGRFGLAHERIYGFKLDQPVEFVNLRAVGVGTVQKISLPKFEKEGPDAAGAVVEQHRAYFDGSFTSVNVYDRAKLPRRQPHPRSGYHHPDGRHDRDPSEPYRRGRRVSEYSDHT